MLGKDVTIFSRGAEEHSAPLAWHAGCLWLSMTINPPRWSEASVERRLAREHGSLDVIFETAAESARTNDTLTFALLWGEFQRRLECHMDGEERFLLRRLDSTYPDEVRAIREDHRRIRELASEIRANSDAGRADPQSLALLRDLLATHKSWEDAGLYSIAKSHIEGQALCSLVEYLREQSYYV